MGAIGSGKGISLHYPKRKGNRMLWDLQVEEDDINRLRFAAVVGEAGAGLPVAGDLVVRNSGVLGIVT